MENKVQKIIIIILVIFAIVFNREIIPSRKEIEELEIIRIIGMDSSSDEKIKFSISRNKKEDINESEAEVLSVRADSFNDAAKDTENYILKQLQGGHIKYFLIGDSAAKESINKYFSFIFHDNELRLNGKIFIAKESSAEKILKACAEKKFEIQEKLQNMENSIYETELYIETTILDLLRDLNTKNRSGLVPSIELIEEEKRNTIKFSGYGIIKNGRLIDYLSIGASRAYSFLRQNVRNTNITVHDIHDGIVNLNITNSMCDFDFKFNGDNLEKIVVNIGFESAINEKYDETQLLDRKYLDSLEYLQNDVIKKELQELFAVAQRMETDILNVDEFLEIDHPYKWIKLENNWDKIFASTPIEILVNSEVERAYDINSMNK